MNHFTLHADGGSRGNPGPAACAAILSNHDVNDLAATIVGSEFLGVATNNVAEWHGLILGLEMALDRGATHVDAYLDSELVVCQMRGEYRVRNPDLIPLRARAAELVAGLTEFTINHIPRLRNTAADALVNETLDAAKSVNATSAPTTLSEALRVANKLGATNMTPRISYVDGLSTTKASQAPPAPITALTVQEALETAYPAKKYLDLFPESHERQIIAIISNQAERSSDPAFCLETWASVLTDAAQRLRAAAKAN